MPDQQSFREATPAAPAVEGKAEFVRPRWLAIVTGGPAAAVVLAAFYALALGGWLDKSATFDEPAHLTGGYSYWTTGDWRLHPENGTLPQRIAALPLLTSHPKFPSQRQLAWYGSDVYTISRQFLYRDGNDPRDMLLAARATMAAVATLLGLLIYLAARRIYGPSGGMVALLAYALSPSFLANGPLVTSDTAAALTLFAFVWAFWALLTKLTPFRLLVSCLLAAAAVLSKTSGLLVVPLAAAMIIVRLVLPQTLPLWRARPLRGPAKLGALAAVAVIHVAVGVVLVWAAYGMRFSTYAKAMPGRDRPLESWQSVVDDAGVMAGPLQAAHDHHLLPEPYLQGVAYTLKHSDSRLAFMNGRYSAHGWIWFFPYCFAVKNPLMFFVLILLAAAAGVAAWRARRRKITAADRPLPKTVPFWTLMGIYGLVCLFSTINIGHRHLLPFYPPLMVLLGAAGRWLDRPGYLMRAGVAAVLVFLAVETLSVWPDELAYFNAAGGGPANGYRHLVDSSLDWGQDLPALKKWVNERHRREENYPIYFSYFGSADPTWYGIDAIQLPGFFDRRPAHRIARLRGGDYCISASMLQLCRPMPIGPWNAEYENIYQQLRPLAIDIDAVYNDPQQRQILSARHGGANLERELRIYDQYRLGRLLAYLRNRPIEPVGSLGYSILIYRLTDADIHEALNGPPPELQRRIDARE